MLKTSTQAEPDEQGSLGERESLEDEESEESEENDEDDVRYKPHKACAF